MYKYFQIIFNKIQYLKLFSVLFDFRYNESWLNLK